MKKLIIAALLGLLATDAAHAQGYSAAEQRQLFAQNVGPALQQMRDVSFARGCNLLTTTANQLFYSIALDSLRGSAVEYTMRHLSAMQRSQYEEYSAAVEHGRQLATSENCAKVRADPEAMLYLKQLVMSYAPG